MQRLPEWKVLYNPQKCSYSPDLRCVGLMGVAIFYHRPIRGSDRAGSGFWTYPSTTFPRFSRTSLQTLRHRLGTLDVDRTETVPLSLLDVDRILIFGIIIAPEHEPPPASRPWPKMTQKKHVTPLVLISLAKASRVGHFVGSATPVESIFGTIFNGRCT